MSENVPMLGLGNIIVFHEGASELVEAQGTEVIGLGSNTLPAAITLANGIKPCVPAEPSWSLELQDIARKTTVTSVAHGADHGIACTLLGSVYVWGSNDSGQMGTLAKVDTVHPTHLKHLASHKVVKIAAGKHHNVALTDDGGVYAWGRNVEGQCGGGFAAPTEMKLYIESTPEVSTVRVGTPSVQAVTSFAPTVSGTDAEIQFLPTSLPALFGIRIQSISCGDFFSVFLAATGHVYACGDNRAGQIGIGSFSSNVRRAARIDIPVDALRSSERKEDDSGVVMADSRLNIDGRVVEAHCGSSHVIARTASRHVFAWGLNCKGQLGVGDYRSRCIPTIVCHSSAGLSAISPFLSRGVSAGAFHSAAITANSNELYTWGSAANGRLGHSYHYMPASLVLQPADAIASEKGNGNVSQGASLTRVGALHSRYTDKGADKPTQQYSVDKETWILPLVRTSSHQLVKQRARQYAVKKAIKRAADALAPDMLKAKLENEDIDDAPAVSQVAKAFARAGVEPGLEVSSNPDEERLMSTGELVAAAATVGVRLSDAEKVQGTPWRKSKLPKDEAGTVCCPVRVSHPALEKRRIVGVHCSDAATSVHLGVSIASITPTSVVDTGSVLMCIAGPGLSALCKTYWAHKDAANVAQEASDTQDQDLKPIPGVFVRFTAEDGAQFMLQAFFPMEWDSGEDEKENDATYFRPDGSLFHTRRTTETPGVHPDLDCVLVLSPQVSKPCNLKVEVVATPPPPTVSALLRDAGIHHTLHVPLGSGSHTIEGHTHSHTSNRAQVVDGSLSVSVHAQPILTNVQPNIINYSQDDKKTKQLIELTGMNLFGCAAIDAEAKVFVKKLIEDVQAALQQREEMEAQLLQRALALPSKPSLAGFSRPISSSASARSISPSISSSRRPESKAADVSPTPTPSVQNPRATADPSNTDTTLLPTLHMQVDCGSEALPNDILVRFEAVKATPSSKHTLGVSLPVKGWYSLRYDESLIDVAAAVDAMTGTTAAQANARTALASMSGMGAGGKSASKSSRFSVRRTVADEEKDNADDDEDEEGCIGTYSASIHCALPALPFLEADSQVEQDVTHRQALYDLLASGEISVNAFTNAVAQGYSINAGGNEFSAEVLSTTQEPVLSSAADSNEEYVIQLYPSISVNGGHSYFSASNLALTLFNPAVHYVWPPAVPHGSESSITLYGHGFVRGKQMNVRFKPFGVDDSLATVVQVLCDSPTWMTVPMPELSPPNAIKGWCGYYAYEVGLSIDGKHYIQSASTRVVVYRGEVADMVPRLIPVSGGSVRLALSNCTVPSVAEYDGKVHAPAAGWLPNVARIGYTTLGLGSKLHATLVNSDGESKEGVSVVSELQEDAFVLQMPPVTEFANSRCWQLAATIHLFDHELLSNASFAYYDPTHLKITAINPKKILPGTEVSVVVEGLEAALLGKEIAAPLASPTKSKAAPPESTAAKPVFATTLWQCRMRFTIAGASFTLPAKNENGVFTAALTNPASADAATVGDATVEISIDAGATFTAPFAFKVVKK